MTKINLGHAHGGGDAAERRLFSVLSSGLHWQKF